MSGEGRGDSSMEGTSQIERRNTEGDIRLKQSEFWNQVGRKWNSRRRQDFEMTEIGRRKERAREESRQTQRGNAGGEEKCLEKGQEDWRMKRVGTPEREART